MSAAPFPGTVIVIGASAGGVEALKLLAAALPAGFPAAVVVVLHLAPNGPSVLPQILDRVCRLPVLLARDGAALAAGTVLVAPPNRHLELSGATVRLTATPPLRHHRPSIDQLFSTAAATLGTRVVGVVLSGALDDGAAGLAAIHLAGGAAVVQEPSEAHYPDMPRSALAAVPEALTLPLDRIADALTLLAAGAPGNTPG